MHNTAPPKVRYLPPSVRFATGGRDVSAGTVAVLASLWVMGALAVLYGLPWRLDAMATGLTVLCLSAVAVYLEACPRFRVFLEWSAQDASWSVVADSLHPISIPCVPAVLLDFQRLLLVRVQCAPSGVHWLWCHRQDASQWHRLRCALFSVRQP